MCRSVGLGCCMFKLSRASCRFRGLQGRELFGCSTVVGSSSNDDHGSGKQDVGLRSSVAEKEEPHEQETAEINQKASGNGSSLADGNG